MIINKISINRFGRLCKTSVDFDKGLNIVYGANESGKSTIHGFIINMLFGMKKGRGKAAKTDDFTRFEPKDAPLEYSGSMEIKAEGGAYILSRDFAAGKRRDTLTALDGMEISPLKGEGIYALLGGISRDAYANTFSILQGDATDRALLSDILTDRYSVLDSNGSYDGVVSESLEALAARQKQLEKQSRKLRQERDERAALLRSKISYVEDEEAALKERLRLEADKCHEASSFDRAADKPEAPQNKGRKASGIIAGIAFFVFAAILFAFLPAPIWLRAAIIAVIALSGIGVILNSRDEKKDLGTKETKNQAAEANIEQEKLVSYIRDSLLAKEKEKERLREQYNALMKGSGEESELDKKISGLILARQTLLGIAGIYRYRHEKLFRANVARIFEYLTSDDDRRIVFEDQIEPVLLQNGVYIPFWQASKGTRDLIELSIRLAAADILSEKEPLPIILDDALVN